MGIFDSVAEQLAKEQLNTQEDASVFSELAGSIPQSSNAIALHNLDVDGPARARHLELSAETNLPVETIERDEGAIRRQRNRDQLSDSIAGIKRVAPVTARMLADPEIGPLIAKREELERMTWFERQWSSIQAGSRKGEIVQQLSDLGNTLIRSDIEDPLVLARKEVLEMEMAELSMYDLEGFFVNIAPWTAEMMPLMFDTFADAVPYGIGGAGIGAGLGAATFTPWGIGTGASVGWAKGFSVGLVIEAGAAEAGLAYLEFRDLDLGDGRKLSKADAKALAIMAGSVNGLLERIGFGAVLRATGGKAFSSRFITKALKRMALDGRTGRLLGHMTGGAGESFLTEGFTEFLQEYVVIFGGQFGKAISGGRFDAYDTVDAEGNVVTLHGDDAYLAMFERAWESARQGAGAGLGMGTGGSVVGGPLAEIRLARRAMRAKERLDHYVEVAIDDELRATSPHLFAEKISLMQAEHGAETEVSIPAEKLVEYYEGDATDQTLEDLRIDLPQVVEQIELAISTGGDVVMRLGDYLAHIAPDHHEGLGGHVRQGVYEKTAEEGAADEEQAAKDLAAGEAAQTGPADPVRESGQRVFDHFFELLREIHPEHHAKLLANFMRRAAETRARATNSEDAMSVIGQILVRPPRRGEERPTTSRENVLRSMPINELLEQLRDPSRRPELQGMPSTPLMDRIRAAGGVNPESDLGKRLKAAGVDLDAVPGLSNPEGLDDLSGIDLAGEEERFRPLPRNDEGGVEGGAVESALAEESAGRPLRTQAERDAIVPVVVARQELKTVILQMGVDLQAESNEEIIERLRKAGQVVDLPAARPEGAEPEAEAVDLNAEDIAHYKAVAAALRTGGEQKLPGTQESTAAMFHQLAQDRGLTIEEFLALGDDEILTAVAAELAKIRPAEAEPAAALAVGELEFNETARAARFMPAVVTPDGNVFQNESGHAGAIDDAIEAAGLDLASDEALDLVHEMEDGFISPEGEFLSREQTAKRLGIVIAGAGNVRAAEAAEAARAEGAGERALAERNLMDEPLGVSREPVLDMNLASMDDSGFEASRIEANRKVDDLERQMDDNPGIEDSDMGFRAKLIKAQDDYDSYRLEDFRRKHADAEPEDIAYAIRNLGDSKEDKVKALLLSDIVARRNISDELRPFLEEYASRSPDHAEVLGSQLDRFAKTVSEAGAEGSAPRALAEGAEGAARQTGNWEPVARNAENWEQLPDGRLIGYRVSRSSEGTAVSGADSRQSWGVEPGTQVELEGQGVFLTNDLEYAKRHYGVHDENVIQRVAFSPDDLTAGRLADAEPEVSVRSGEVLGSDFFTDPDMAGAAPTPRAAEVAVDINGSELVGLDGTPVPVNADGTITVYHRTTANNAARIEETGRFVSEENTGEAFFSTRRDGQAAGYGDTVVEVRLDPSTVRLDDAFPDGEVHLAADASSVLDAPTPRTAEGVPRTVVKDAAGNPRVFYHGTSAEFAPRNFRENAMFSSSEGYARHRGKRVIAVHLDIRNPADLREMNLSPSAHNFAEIAERLKLEGYDGAQYRDDVWIAFSPDQIHPVVTAPSTAEGVAGAAPTALLSERAPGNAEMRISALETFLQRFGALDKLVARHEIDIDKVRARLRSDRPFNVQAGIIRAVQLSDGELVTGQTGGSTDAARARGYDFHEDIIRAVPASVRRNDPRWSNPKRGFVEIETGIFYTRVEEELIEQAMEKAQIQVFARSRIARIRAGSEFQQGAVRLRRKRETLKRFGLDPNGTYTIRQVAAALEARQREAQDVILRGDYSDAALSNLARWMAEEVRFELTQPDNALGWYDVKFQAALDKLGGTISELVDDAAASQLAGIDNARQARDLFAAYIAISSDGQSPVGNMDLAIRLFEAYRDNDGQVPPPDFGGERRNSMRRNVELIGLLIGERGIDGMRDFLLTEKTVSKLQADAEALGLGTLDTDYLVGTTLPMSALVFGDKVGVFYANLMGLDGYLTMDRWWTRTFNRYRGEIADAATKQGLLRLRRLMAEDAARSADPTVPEATLSQAMDLLREEFDALSDDEVLALSVPIRNRYKARGADEKGKGGFKRGTEIEKAANTIYKAAFEKLVDRPKTGAERKFMFDVALRVQRNLKRSGREVSIANIQALLWFFEKRLYGGLGARTRDDTSFEETVPRALELRAGRERPDPPDPVTDETEGLAGTAIEDPGPAGQEEQIFGQAIATIEVGEELSELGAQASAIAAESDTARAELSRILRDAIRESARGDLWSVAISAITGRSITVEIDPEAFGSYLGLPAPNIRVELSGLSSEEVELFNAVVGRILNQAAMAASTVEYRDAKGDEIAGYSAVFAAELTEAEIASLVKALPEGHDISSHGQTVDVNPRWGEEGAVGISEEELTASLEASGLSDKVVLLPHAYSSVYTESDQYGEIISRGEDQARQRRGAQDRGAGAEDGGIARAEEALGPIRQGLLESLSDFVESRGAQRVEQPPVEPRAAEELDRTDQAVAAFNRREFTLFQPAKHGGPRDFDAFDLAFVGTGESSQVVGWGLYFTQLEDVAEFYRLATRPGRGDEARDIAARLLEEAGGDRERASLELIRRRDREGATQEFKAEMEAAIDSLSESGEGQVFHAEIPDDHQLLLWDKPLSEHHPDVIAMLEASTGVVREVYDEVRQREGQGQIAGAREVSVHRVIAGSGADFYRTLSDRQAAASGGKRDRAASEALRDVGVLGHKFLDRGSREAGGIDPDSFNFVIWDDTAILITDRLYEQPEEPGAGAGTGAGVRGFIRFGPELESVVIQMTEAADLSTFLHESGHLFLELLRRDAYDPGASPRLMEDLNAVRRWWSDISPAIKDEAQKLENKAAIQENRDAVVITDADVAEQIARDRPLVSTPAGKAVNTAMHEQWARHFEAYLFSGQAPSLELMEAFAAFRAWLKGVYETLLGIESTAGQKIGLTPEIREVMDRILATDAEIQEVRLMQKMLPLFESAEAGGMTEGEFSAYERALNRAIAAANNDLDRMVLKELKREQTEKWKRDRARVRAEVEQDVNSRPVFQVKHWLQHGEFLGRETPEGLEHARMDRDKLVLMRGRGILRKLSSGRFGLWQAKDGLHPDVVAQMFGFTSGDAMITELLRSGTRTKVIEQETDARMLELYGDILNDGSLTHLAVAALTSNETARFLQAEVRALARKAGAQPTPIRIAREAARRIVEDAVVRSLTPGRYRQAEIRHARDAARSAAEGDFVAAHESKRKQLLNHYLAIEAMNALQETNVFLRYEKKFDRKTTRTKLAKAGEGFLDQIDSLRERFDLRKGVSQQAALNRQQLADFIVRQEQLGNEVMIEQKFRDLAFKKHYRDMTIKELRGLRDAIKNLEHMARRKVEWITEAETLELEDIRGQLAGSALENVAGKPPSDVALLSKVASDLRKHSMRSWLASMIKVEFLVDALDGGKPGGPWRTYVFEPIARAEAARTDLSREYTQKLMELMTEFSKLQSTSGYGEILTVDLTFEGKPVVLTKWSLISMALNTGNESNYAKLLGGYGWKHDDVVSVLEKHLTQADKDFVVELWKLIHGLWPLIEANQRKLVGLPPKKVKGQDMTGLFGIPTGEFGYYPVAYDPDRAEFAYRHAEKAGIWENVEGQFFRAVTGHGYTYERTDTAAPILLDLWVLPMHIDGVIHDVTHREVLMRVDELLQDKRVSDALDQTIGKEHRQLFRPWLQGIAGDRIIESKALKIWERMLRGFRINATTFVLGFRYTTLVAQVAGHSNAMEILRQRLPNWREHYAEGLRLATAGFKISQMQAVVEEVISKSGEMRNRIGQVDRDLRDGIRRTIVAVEAGKLVIPGLDVTADGMRRLQRTSMQLIGKVQFYAVDLSVWLAAYNGALVEYAKDGITEEEAVAYADSIVRLSQGGGGQKDLAEIQRMSEWVKMWLLFYSYMNTVFNQLSFGFRRAYNLRSVPDFFAALFFYAWLPGLYAALSRGDIPDEDDDWQDIAKWIAKRGLGELTGTIPVARDFGPVFFGSSRFGGTPLSRVFQFVVDLSNPRDIEEMFFDIGRMGALLKGLPFDQASRVAERLLEEDRSGSGIQR